MQRISDPVRSRNRKVNRSQHIPHRQHPFSSPGRALSEEIAVSYPFRYSNRFLPASKIAFCNACPSGLLATARSCAASAMRSWCGCATTLLLIALSLLGPPLFSYSATRAKYGDLGVRVKTAYPQARTSPPARKSGSSCRWDPF